MPLSICTIQPSHLKKKRIVHGKRDIFLDGGPSSIGKKRHPLSLNFCSGLVNLTSTGLELNYRGAHSRCEIAKAFLLQPTCFITFSEKPLKLRSLFVLAIFQLVIFSGREVVAGGFSFWPPPAPLHCHTPGLSGGNSLLQEYLPLFLHYCYRPIC